MVKGTRKHAEALWDETSAVLAPIGLCLSEEKTRICHIDEGGVEAILARDFGEV